MPRVVIDLDAETRLRLIAVAKGESGYRGANSKKRRIRDKVLKRIIGCLVEHAVRCKLEAKRE